MLLRTPVKHVRCRGTMVQSLYAHCKLFWEHFGNKQAHVVYEYHELDQALHAWDGIYGMMLSDCN